MNPNNNNRPPLARAITSRHLAHRQDSPTEYLEATIIREVIHFWVDRHDCNTTKEADEIPIIDSVWLLVGGFFDVCSAGICDTVFAMMPRQEALLRAQGIAVQVLLPSEFAVLHNTTVTH